MTTEDSDHDDDYVVEESPCGRWHRRRQTVSYSAVPGIDAAFMAMDMDEGLEVIWNEVTYSESKDYRAQEKQMKASLDSMISITHPNIVKFHHYWVKEPKKEATGAEPIKVVFITEYTSSGTLRSFLRKTNAKNWSRWCNQLLSALHYMHTVNTVHGNLTTDTIFLQHQGLIKIGCFSITMMRNYVKTNAEEHNHRKNNWYFPPNEEQSPKFDIYSFGVIALEMLIPGLISEAEKGKLAQGEMLSRIDTYSASCSDDDRDKCEFIKTCLHLESHKRPDAKFLSRHEALFTLSQLRILAAHAVVEYRDIYSREGKYSLDYIVKKHKKEEDDNPKKEVCFSFPSGNRHSYSVKDLPMATGDLDKLVLDVENGLYPTGFGREPTGSNMKGKHTDEPVQLPGVPQRAMVEVEDRRAAHIECYITRGQNDECKITIDVDLARTLPQDEERTPECKRHLQTTLVDSDTPEIIAQELARYAFISYEDVEVMTHVIQDQYDLIRKVERSS